MNKYSNQIKKDKIETKIPIVLFFNASSCRGTIDISQSGVNYPCSKYYC